MKTRFLLIFIFCAFSLFSISQVDTLGRKNSKNHVNFTLFGYNSTVSVSYERFFFKREKSFLSFTSGLGIHHSFIDYSYPRVFITLPHSLSYNFGKKYHFFEIGLAGSYIHGRAYNSYIFNTLIGYRFYPFKEKKCYFKVFLNVPIIGLLKERIEFYTLVLIKDDHISTPFGVSFGF